MNVDVQSIFMWKMRIQKEVAHLSSILTIPSFTFSFLKSYICLPLPVSADRVKTSSCAGAGHSSDQDSKNIS